ncbi:MAG: ribonuclease HII [Cyanobacteria bacterium J06648_11]
MRNSAQWARVKRSLPMPLLYSNLPEMPPIDLNLEDIERSGLPQNVAGVDEAGRGAWFGAVVAAAVMLTQPQRELLQQAGATDSKKLTAVRREELAIAIRQHARAWALGWAHPHDIDRVNILQATFLAARRALYWLDPPPHACAMDGNHRIAKLKLPQIAVVKGDSKCIEIAFASILAKTHRDRWMQCLAKRYPGYDLAANKGYGTPAHRRGVERLGTTPLHRLSYGPCQQRSLPLET